MVERNNGIIIIWFVVFVNMKMGELNSVVKYDDEYVVYVSD